MMYWTLCVIENHTVAMCVTSFIVLCWHCITPVSLTQLMDSLCQMILCDSYNNWIIQVFPDIVFWWGHCCVRTCNIYRNLMGSFSTCSTTLRSAILGWNYKDNLIWQSDVDPNRTVCFPIIMLQWSLLLTRLHFNFLILCRENHRLYS